jgi:hypothetical protein
MDKQWGFVWSDAWLFFALGVAAADDRRPVTATEVIQTGDYINHAILTSDELDEGGSRLRDAGYIKISGQSFSLTPDGIELWQQCQKPSVAETFGALRDALHIEAPKTSLSPFQDRDWATNPLNAHDLEMLKQDLHQLDEERGRQTDQGGADSQI